MADWFACADDTTGGTNDPAIPYKSRRSPVVCSNGCVATSQPLASSIGLQILVKGGNAADAALAVAAALAVTEPCSTGLGGDMFAIYYNAGANTGGSMKRNLGRFLDARHRKHRQRRMHVQKTAVTSINGSGRCPGNLTLDALTEKYPNGSGGVDVAKHSKSVDAVTVPGAARGWEDFYYIYASGKFSFLELLEPAAKLAEEGFPVAPITARAWSSGLENDIKKWLKQENGGSGGDVPLSMPGGRGPRPGDIMKNPDMARVLRSLGRHGATKGFYEGFPGTAMVDVIQKYGGSMTADDLQEHRTQCTYPDCISVEYGGVKVHQVPPNGQGIAGLIALSGLRALEEREMVPKSRANQDASGWASVDTWHGMMEMMRLGFRDAREFVCDAEFCEEQGRQNIVSSDYLLDSNNISERAGKVFNPAKAVVQGMPDRTSCTVSFQVVDKEGNAVSFVNSNFMGFGTGIVPDGCGFTLQNRGAGFSFEPKHPNVIEPYKRPYHTIIPAMITHADTNELYATLSNMGGYMQPQGIMQLTVALTSGLNPQTAIDQPRFCISDGTHNGTAMIEEGVDEDVIAQLKKKGHKIETGVAGLSRAIFGKAQIIKRDRETGVLWAGSDGRSDGCAMGY